MRAEEKAEYLEVATELACGAGPIALQYFRRGAAVANKLGEGRFDPVTAADREIESWLRRELDRRYPAHGVRGEEHDDKQADGPLSWIIDPIDGTRAFISGMPAWGIMIGLLEDGVPQIGVVHQPFTGETFFGDGAAAWLRNAAGTEPMRCRAADRLSDAVLYCTHPSMFSGAEVDAFGRVASAAQMARFGGDCYAYCLVALGEVDLVVESELQPYDILPLIPILEGAGARVTDWTGSRPLAGGRVLAAASAALHDEALATLNWPGNSTMPAK